MRVDDRDHVLLPRPRVVGPVHRAGPDRCASRTTYLWCIRSGTPATASPRAAASGSAPRPARAAAAQGSGSVVDVVDEADGTPRSSARRIASPTIAAVSGPRSKSYWASSSVRFAPSRNVAICDATSAGVWPPSVRVRIVREGSSSVSSPPGSAGPTTSTVTASGAAAAARPARGVSRRAAPARGSCSSARRPGTVGRACPASRSPPSAS